MKLVSAYKTDTGLKRERNEDYLWVDERAGVYVVADGMGGHEAGDTASRLAAITIGEAIAGNLQAAAPAAEVKKLMADAIEAANQAVWTASGEAGQTRRMGATVIVAVAQLPSIYISHAGDTRAYLIRDKALSRLTKDDSWAAQLVDSGVISEDEAEHHRNLHFVTKAVGQESPVEPDFIQSTLKTGDYLLLCSDGLWNMVTDPQVLSKFKKEKGNLALLVDSLIEAANAAGGKDNITVIILKAT
ncbi:MAG TPA: Stp1/IreP family PP2C-type Ser/Thr phosphatase, partial [Chloroflexi bacterium]|nr:Stp1/IreP family PP2C-type Ser/Thr phosphatase [Chloroflexota bacterium]